MNLSKLQQEGREEFEKRFGAFALLGKAGRFYNGAFANEARIREAQDYLDAQIEKAYLAALSDVKKWTKGRNVTKDSLRGFINKLKESK